MTDVDRPYCDTCGPDRTCRFHTEERPAQTRAKRKHTRRNARALANLSPQRAIRNAQLTHRAARLLENARDALVEASAPRAADKVRSALRSALGAERHAQNIAMAKRTDASQGETP